MKNSQIITFSIFKGGTGKTTSAVNVAAGLIKMGEKVLLVDLDQQALATRHLGIDPEPLSPTLYDVYVRKAPISLVRIKMSFKFDLVPGHPLRAGSRFSGRAGLRTAARASLAPYSSFDALGFRCAMNAE